MSMRKIRKVIDSDLESIKTVYEKAFDRSEGILNCYYKGFSEYVDFCAKQNYAYVALDEEVVCGILLAYEKPDTFYGKVVYIELLAVLPEYQKKGFGTGLLNKVKEDAQSNGICELSLRTGYYMDAYQIYKKYGFRDTEDDHRYMVLNIKQSET